MSRLRTSALIVFLCCIRICAVEVRPTDVPASVYLPPKKMIYSPNGEVSCFTRNLSSGQTLYLRRGNSETPLYTTTRNLGVTWAPNSKWLAISDNYAAGENRIIVYDVSRNEPTAIAETSVGEAWMIVRWDVPNKTLLVQSFGDRHVGTPL